MQQRTGFIFIIFAILAIVYCYFEAAFVTMFPLYSLFDVVSFDNYKTELTFASIAAVVGSVLLLFRPKEPVK